jgi:hypothetical protein
MTLYLTTFMCRLSKNLGASTSWSPKGLPQACMGLLLHDVIAEFDCIFFNGLITWRPPKWRDPCSYTLCDSLKPAPNAVTECGI